MTTLLDLLGSGCNQCGRCCMNQHQHPLMISGEDLERWDRAGAPGAEIMEWLSVAEHDGQVLRIDCWFDPDSGDAWEGRDCPWLERDSSEKYYCGIYELRPNVCRAFPLARDQIETHCIPGGVVVNFDAEAGVRHEIT